MPSPASGWFRCTSRGTPTREPTSSTRTRITFATACGGSIDAPSDDAARCRPWSNGTKTSRAGPSSRTRLKPRERRVTPFWGQRRWEAMRDPRDGSLARLQRFVTEAVRGAAAAKADPARSREADQWVAPGGRGLAPADRLDIYRDQYWLRHVGNLVDDFPTLEWIVGAPAFRALASRYLTAHPPRTWNLQRLGADPH